MIGLILRRLVTAVPMLLLVTIVAFSMVDLLPGDAAVAIAGEDATPERLAAIRAQLGLDDPFLVRYIDWLGGLITADIGNSIITSQPVVEELLRRAPVSGSIALGTLAIALLIGIPMGLLQGMFAHRLFDRISLIGTAVALAVPSFWLATILISIFAVNLNLLPAFGYVPFSEDPAQWAKHLIMPSIALGTFAAAELSRQLRTGFLEVNRQPYVQTAMAKGLPRHRVVGKHIMKNAAAPAITVLGIRLSHLLAGTVIVEEIFGIPGLGKYAIESIRAQDMPVIQALILFSALVVVLVNLLIDICYGLLNPKVRLS